MISPIVQHRQRRINRKARRLNHTHLEVAAFVCAVQHGQQQIFNTISVDVAPRFRVQGPLSLALELPFQFKLGNSLQVPAGRLASRQEIETEWKKLKYHPMREQFARQGAWKFRSETNLELSPATQQQLFLQKTSSTEAALARRFTDWVSWPADAQLCVQAMGWGLGTGDAGIGKFVKFNAACKEQDFETAAAESRISTWPLDRNAASLTLMGNAGRVVASPKRYLISALYYPHALTADAATTPA